MSNDFIPFAVGGSANVTPQATYAANTSLTQNGFVAGIAKSTDLNKVWRQSSIMSAVLAQFISNQTGQNSVDDGTTATLIANLLAAVQVTARGAASGVVGSVRNLAMSVTAASTTATLTADEIIVETALGGVRYCLPSFNKTINLATTGAGGMDTGTAPVSGYVALYAIYNPTTGASALLATNATSAVAPSIYGGANMPSGYTASALVSVWGTNGSGQFTVGWQVDRKVFTTLITVLSASSALSNVAESIAGAVPKNAKTSVITQNQLMGGTGASSFGLTIAGSPIPGIGNQTCNLAATGIVQFETTLEIPLVTPQTIYVTWTVTGGSSPSLTLYSTAYTF